MKKRILSMLLILIFLPFVNCGGNSGGETSTLLAVLANRKCKSLPKTITTFDDLGNIDEIVHCSTAGLVYKCQPEMSSFVNVRTYSSVDGARLGVVDSPDGLNFFLVGERGLASFKIFDELDPSNVSRYFTFVYDSSHRLVSLTNELTANTDIFSNYDGQGFPGNSDAPAGFSYGYDFDTGMLNDIFSSGYEIQYDSKGWAKNWSDSGGSSGYFESSGSVEICE